MKRAVRFINTAIAEMSGLIRTTACKEQEAAGNRMNGPLSAGSPMVYEGFQGDLEAFLHTIFAYNPAKSWNHLIELTS